MNEDTFCKNNYNQCYLCYGLDYTFSTNYFNLFFCKFFVLAHLALGYSYYYNCLKTILFLIFQRLPDQINEKNEKMKAEMMG